MRTQEEIVAKLREHQGKILDFTPDVLLPYLDFDHAKQFLKPDATREGWESPHGDDQMSYPLSEETALREFRAYAEFAWGKAQDHRGLSAERSVQKLEAWTWLLGRDDVLAASEAAHYQNYGCPKLAVICEAFGFPIPDDEPTQRMVRGEPCKPDCESGCGQ